MSHTLFSLLRIPPDHLEEIAVVVCDSCPQNAFPQRALEKALAVPFTCLSTSQIQASPSLASRRVQLASCVISVSSCSLRCPFHLLSSLRFPEHSLLLTPSDSPQDTAKKLHDLAASMLSHLTPSLPPPLSAPTSSSPFALSASFSSKETRNPSLSSPSLPSSSRLSSPSALPSIAAPSFAPSSSFATSPFLPHRLDYRGLSCPMPIIRLQKDLPLISDEIVEIIADDPAFPADLEAFCLQKNITFVSVHTQGTLITATIARPRSPSKLTLPVTSASSNSPDLPPSSSSVPLFLSPPPSPSPPPPPPSLPSPLATLSSVEPWELPSSAVSALLDSSTPHPLHSTSAPHPLNSAQIAKILPSEADLSALFRGISFLAPPKNFSDSSDLLDEILSEKTSPLLPSSAPEKHSLSLELPRLSSSQPSLKRPPSAELPRLSSSFPPVKPPSSPRLKADRAEPSAPPLSLDCRGLKCPLPIVRLGQFIKQHPDASIEITADDPAFPADLEAFCQAQNFDILTHSIQGDLSSFVVQPRS